MRKYVSCLYVMAALFMLVQSANGAVRTWQIDPAHSNFYFSVDHIYSKVRGHFNDFSGTVMFDPDNLAESSMEFTIQTSSIDTNIAKRDKHLQSPDFFDAPKYPDMTFTSKSITAAGDGEYLVQGTFTVKGKPYELTLPLQLAGVKAHPMQKGQDVAGFNGRIVIDRLAYGVGTGKFYEYGVVGKDVEILVTLEVLSDQP